MINDEINDFVKTYRETLDMEKDKALQNLENTRKLQHQSIMSNANKAGMMYSTFPERAKIQYNTGTYEPAVSKINQSYQTGVDKIRDSSASLYNSLAGLREQVDEFKRKTAKLKEDSSTEYKAPVNEDGTPKDINDYTATELSDLYKQVNVGNPVDYDANAANRSNTLGDWQFQDAEGNAIRFGTYAKRLGATNNEEILDMAKLAFGANSNEYKQLKTIVDRQANTKHPNLYFNVGKNFEDLDPKKYENILNDDDRNFLNGLGLGFTFE